MVLKERKNVQDMVEQEQKPEPKWSDFPVLRGKLRHIKKIFFKGLFEHTSSPIGSQTNDGQGHSTDRR